MRYAIIDKNTHIVVNVVEYEAPPDDPLPGFGSDFMAVQSDVAGVGWTLTNDVLTPPPPPIPTTGEVRIMALMNHRTLIERRADQLEKAGDMLGAIQLRLTL